MPMHNSSVQVTTGGRQCSVLEMCTNVLFLPSLRRKQSFVLFITLPSPCYNLLQNFSLEELWWGSFNQGDSFMPQVQLRGTARVQVQPQFFCPNGDAKIRKLANFIILVLLGQTEDLQKLWNVLGSKTFFSSLCLALLQVLYERSSQQRERKIQTPLLLACWLNSKYFKHFCQGLVPPVSPRALISDGYKSKTVHRRSAHANTASDFLACTLHISIATGQPSLQALQ